MTLFEALTGGFDPLNYQQSGEFDQNFSKKSNAQGFARGRGGWAVLELTGTLPKGTPFACNPSNKRPLKLYVLVGRLSEVQLFEKTCTGNKFPR